MNSGPLPSVVVIASLFPSARRPVAGLFIRERMFRVAERMPLCVVSPQPWFPLQGLIRRFRPNYRPPQPAHELQQGIDVWFPRFLSLPGVARWLDGFFMALACLRLVRRLRRERGINLLDAHFAYPEGYAATNLIDMAGQIEARPLLIHGLADTNVHLQNTVNFIQALEEKDKLFNFVPLPNLSHSFRGDGLVAALSASADYLSDCLE